jgi:hypothetical protein
MSIAERILHILPDGIAVPIRLEAPDFVDGGWRCRYAIGWPDGAWESAGYGADAVQALHLTLQKIGVELYTSPEHEAGQLVWPAAGGGGGYGFPVPANARDLLVGDDARWF